MNSLPNLEDLNIFVQVAKRASFAAVADELGMSAAYISKRIRLLEQNLEVRLLHRTTRRVTVSEEGERVYQWALQIFDAVQRMGDDISAQHREPAGQLRIASSLGLGRRFVAPALSELAERYPLSCHGLSLSLGGSAPLDVGFLQEVRVFLDHYNVPLYSEHLSYCSDDGHLYDLLPIPFTDEAVRHTAARIAVVLDLLGRRIAV